jgi:hypothetical protein
MKRWFLIASLILAMVPSTLRASDGTFIWDGVKIVPPDIAPQIDAFNVINNGTMSIDFTNLDYYPLFDTSSTLNFTNTATGYLNCNLGFQFDTAPVSFGVRQRSANFENDGVISSGAHAVNLNNLTNLTLVASVLLGTGGARTFVNADNVISPGTFDLGFESLLRIDGSSVNLSRGKFDMQAVGLTPTPIGAPPLLVGVSLTNFLFPYLYVNDNHIYDGFWGAGVDIVNPNAQYTQPASQSEVVQDRQYNFFAAQVGGPQSVSYFDQFFLDPSNVITRVVYLNNTNADFPASVYFYQNAISIEWLAHPTNLFETNTIAVNLLDFGTSLFLAVNGFSGGAPRLTFIPSGIPLGIPSGFEFVETNQSLIGTRFPSIPPTGPSPVPPGTFPNTDVFVNYANYQALFPPTTRVLSDVTGQNVTNLPGRIEVNAGNYLDLSLSQISSDNYLLLKSPGHFGGNTGSRIYSPFTDLNLRSTNGALAITNLLLTKISKPEGTIDVYSATFTDINNFITNTFEVLFVDARLSPTIPARQQDIVLRSTTPSGQGGDDLVISDVLTVTHSLQLDTERLTITTNGAGAAYPAGGIDITDSRIVWTTSAPRLRYLTNNGRITAVNAMFLGGSRTSPVDSSVVNVPYEVFINSGGVTNSGSLIWAKLFQNSGTIEALTGSISLQQAQAAILTNGAFFAPNGDISIQGNGVLVSNHVFQAGGAITLSPSVSLDDGTFASGCPEFNTNKNFWVSTGVNLTVEPPLATLASTTVSNFAPPFRNVVNRWAAADRGATPAGFDNNAVIGRLVLNGGLNSQFTFSAATGGNAIYVDRLELENFTTNYIGNDLQGISIDPNMKVYYGQALAAGVSVAEKINGYEGGRLIWVSNYNCGFYSSTNLVYPDGSTNRVNAALAASCNIDSDGDNVVNCVDLSPIPPGELSACPCNVVNITLPVSLSSGGGGSGSGPGPTSGSGLKLEFPNGPNTGQTNSVELATASYSGLFYETNSVAAPSSGYFTAVTSSRGTYTGKITIGGRTYSFSGKFDSVTGLSAATVSRGMQRSLTVHLQLDSGTDQIRGSVSDGHWTANLMADKLVFGKSAHPNQAGSYTLVIPGDSEDPNSPAGHSFGTIKVDANGNVTWSGSLADGSKVTQKSTLSADGIWPLYSSLYGGKGCVLGWVQLTNDSVGGDLIWIKPADASSKYYPGGFTNLINSIGSPYSKPGAGTRVLNWSDGLGQFSISGGGLGQSLTNSIRLELNNRVTNLSGPKLNLNITPSSGLFHGTFVDPDSNKSEPFQGVLFQDSNIGIGYFLGPAGSGEIRLGPAP